MRTGTSVNIYRYLVPSVIRVSLRLPAVEKNEKKKRKKRKKRKVDAEKRSHGKIACAAHPLLLTKFKYQVYTIIFGALAQHVRRICWQYYCNLLAVTIYCSTNAASIFNNFCKPIERRFGKRKETSERRGGSRLCFCSWGEPAILCSKGRSDVVTLKNIYQRCFTTRLRVDQ